MESSENVRLYPEDLSEEEIQAAKRGKESSFYHQAC